MGVSTAISWTDHTFNPWWGCTRVSDGCRFCYAETFAKRVGQPVWGKGQPRRFFGDKHWAEPRAWDRAAAAAGQPALVFCASMADVFEDRPDLVSHRRRLFGLIEETPNLQWQLLTKRPENIAAMVPAVWMTSGWPANCWAGCTVEHQEAADERVPVILDIPAPVRFLSMEPLLAPVDLRPEWIELELQAFGANGVKCFPRVDWIVVGGESGPHHRPLDLDAARSLRNQAAEAGIPYFFKQVGGVHPTSGGDELDGERIHQFPPQAGDRS